MTLILINQNEYWYEHQDSIKSKYQPKNLTEQMVMTIIEADLVEKLKKYFLNPEKLNAYRFQDQTALIHQAAKVDAIDCLIYLIKNKADVNLITPEGLKPLEYAIENKALKACQILRENGAKAYDKTLVELINQDKRIYQKDKVMLLKGIELISEYQALLTNIKDYLNQLCLHIIENRNDYWFIWSMKLMMKDHQQKLIKLEILYEELDHDVMLALLDQYALTKKMTKSYHDVCYQIENDNELLNVLKSLIMIDDIKAIKWHELNKFYAVLANL